MVTEPAKTTLTRYSAVLFDMDGVLTSTTALHAACWKETFDHVLGPHGVPFDIEREYVELLDGKTRQDGVRDFLNARGIDAPEGTPTSPPEEWSVHGIANRKQTLVERRLADHGVRPFPGSVRWVKRLRRDGSLTAVVSSS